MEAVKLIFDLVGSLITAKAEQRAEILAKLSVAIETLQAADIAEDAAHEARNAETKRVIAEELAKQAKAPNPTVLVDPETVAGPDEDTNP